MTKSLLVNCSFIGKISADLFTAASQFNECTVINFGDIAQDYRIA